MFIDTEKNQEFLALAYSLQNNKSNAVIDPNDKVDKIQSQKVYRAINYKTSKYIYSLNPIQNIPKESETSRNKGGRPKILTEEQKKDIITWSKKGTSNREIARKLGVADKTIGNFLKTINKQGIKSEKVLPVDNEVIE